MAPVCFVAIASTRDAEDCMKLQFALDACDHADPFLDAEVVPDSMRLAMLWAAERRVCRTLLVANCVAILVLQVM